MKTNYATIIILFTMFCVAPARAVTHTAWTAVASTGAVDEASLGIYTVSGPAIGYSPGSTSTDSIVTRINVTNGYDYIATHTPPWTTLELGYWDNSEHGSVSATLWQVVPFTGEQTALCTVTSDDSPTSTRKSCALSSGLDFRNYVFYVAIKLTRDSTLPLPCAYAVRLYDGTP